MRIIGDNNSYIAYVYIIYILYIKDVHVYAYTYMRTRRMVDNY